MSYVYPADFGAYPLESDPYGDPTSGLQAAIDHAQTTFTPLRFPSRKTFRTTAPLIGRQGFPLGAGYMGRKALTVYGEGSEIRPAHNAMAWMLDSQCDFDRAQSIPGSEFGQVIFEDMAIGFSEAEANGYHDAYAFQIGRDGFTWNSEERSRFDGITIKWRNLDLFNENAIRVTNARNMAFRDLTCFGGMLIEDTSNHPISFAGDVWISDSDIRGRNVDGRRPIHLRAVGSDGGTHHRNVEGVSIYHTHLYGGGSKIEASGLGAHRRHSLDNVYFAETEGGHVLMELSATDGGWIERQQFTNCDWNRLPSNGGARMMKAVADENSKANGIVVAGGMARDVKAAPGEPEAFYFEGIDRGAFRDVVFVGDLGDVTPVRTNRCTGFAVRMAA